jgi:hypothetical protein
VLIPCGIGLALLCVMINGLVRGRAIPCGTACIVINIISPAERIDSTFPSFGERAKLIFACIVIVLSAIVRSKCLSRGDNAMCGRPHWVLGMNS